MHAKHALRLDYNLGEFAVLLIGISAVSPCALDFVASDDGIHAAS